MNPNSLLCGLFRHFYFTKYSLFQFQLPKRFLSGEVIVSLKNVCFEYVQRKPILDNVTFTIREKNKVTIMGQNGSGKSTILKLLSGQLKPDSGSVNIKDKLVIASARQVMPRECENMTVWDFFKHYVHGNESGLDGRIAHVLNLVNLDTSHKRVIKGFSGGQQARLLLASSLIIAPDILLLDEPTNNLDVNGVAFLRDFIKNIDKTVIVSQNFIIPLILKYINS